MSKTKREVVIWGACLLFGASILFAERRSSATTEAGAMDAPLVEPVRTASVLPIPAKATPTLKAAAPATPGVNTRLVAELLVNSIIAIESSGNPRMVGSHGERGLMQIKSATWGYITEATFGKRIPFSRAFEARLNREVGAAYLAYLQNFLGRHRASWKADERSLLLACYNAGPERVKRAGFDLRRLPASTRDYIKRGSAMHDTYMADYNLDVKRVRLAMDLHLKSARGG